MLNSSDFDLPILGICASSSNAGKTTLITQLIPELAKRNIRVSVIKHAHHTFDIDHPGKDSFQIREAGAVQTLIASSKRVAVMTELSRVKNHTQQVEKVSEEAPELQELLTQINPHYADLVLVEGFKNAPIAKIEVHRPNLDMPLLAPTLPNVIAIASDAVIDINLPVLNLNDISAIAHFISHWLNSRVST